VVEVQLGEIKDLKKSKNRGDSKTFQEHKASQLHTGGSDVGDREKIS
jgi:hypothetical protein